MDRERALEERLDEIEKLVRTLVVRVTELELHPPASAEPAPEPPTPMVRPLEVATPVPPPPEPTAPVARPGRVEQTTRTARHRIRQTGDVVRGSARRTDPGVARRARDRRRSRVLPRDRRRSWLDRGGGTGRARVRRLDDPSRSRPVSLRAAGPDRSGRRRGRERARRALRIADVRDCRAGGHRPGSGAPRRRNRRWCRRGDRRSVELAVRRRARLARRTRGTRPRGWRDDGAVARFHGRCARRDGRSSSVATLGLARARRLPGQRAAARVLVVGPRRPPLAARDARALLVSLRRRGDRVRAPRSHRDACVSRRRRCSC